MYCFEGMCIYNCLYMNVFLYLYVNKFFFFFDNVKYLYIGNDILVVFVCNF